MTDVNNTISPEQQSALNDRINDQLQKMGVDPQRATKEERVRAIYILKEEHEKGQVTTPEGDIISGYSSEGYDDDDNSESNLGDAVTGVKNNVAGLDPERRNQLFLVGGVLLLALGLIAFRLLSGVNVGGLDWFKAKPTAAPEIPVDYSIFVDSLGNELSQSFDEPQSFNFRTNTFAIYPSKSSIVNKNEVWCDTFNEDTYNDSCWLEGSIVNMVIGIRYKTYIGLFTDVAPGEIVTMKFGTREIKYTIKEIKTIKINDTAAAFGQESPRLTFVVFGERDNNGTLVDPTNQERTIVIATPNQDDLAGINLNVGNEVQSIEYTGENTVGKIFDLDTQVTVRSFSAGTSNGIPYYKVIATLKPKTSSTLSQYANFQYSFESGLSYSPMQQAVDSAKGEYRLVFIVQNDGTDQQGFALKVNVKGQKTSTVITGSIYPPLPLQYVNVLPEDVHANYNSLARQLTVTIPYTMDKDAPAELCQQCSLLVNGEPIQPTGQIYFNPPTQNNAKGSISMVFSVVIVSNVNDLQLQVGKYLFALSPEPDPTPTATPKP